MSNPEGGSSFSAKSVLRDHDVSARSSLNHVCVVCHKGFQDPTLLERHVTAHKTLQHCCDICGELCENKVDFCVHVTTVHKYKGQMVCDLCLKTFSSVSNLKLHFLNGHTKEMSNVLQKWELLCNVHSPRNVRKEYVLKVSNSRIDRHLHPKEKESRGVANSIRSDASTSHQTMDDSERPNRSAMTDDLKTYLQEQSGKESWYAGSIDHLSCSMRPNDILERIQSLTKNANRHQKEPLFRCNVCDSIYCDKNDYMLSHDGQDPSKVYPHKQKSASERRFEQLINFHKFISGSTSHVHSEKSIDEHSDIKADVSHQDRNERAESQNDQLFPTGTLLAEISELASQIENKEATQENPEGSV